MWRAQATAPLTRACGCPEVARFARCAGSSSSRCRSACPPARTPAQLPTRPAADLPAVPRAGPVKRTRLVVLFDGEDKPVRLAPHLVRAHRTGFCLWTAHSSLTRSRHRADGSGHDHGPSWKWDRPYEGIAPELTACGEESAPVSSRGHPVPCSAIRFPVDFALPLVRRC